MTLYQRDSDCGVCGKPVMWDSEKKVLWCEDGCVAQKCELVNLKVFHKVSAKANRLDRALGRNAGK